MPPLTCFLLTVLSFLATLRGCDGKMVARCLQAPLRGDCSRHRVVYGFGSGECFRYIYSGCGGSANRFDTRADCTAACLGDAVKPGACPRLEIGPCRDDCAEDGGCPADLKCCSNGCGRQCMPPLDIGTPAPNSSIAIVLGFCPNGESPLMSSGRAIPCLYAEPTSCPPLFKCQQSLKIGGYYCCPDTRPSKPVPKLPLGTEAPVVELAFRGRCPTGRDALTVNARPDVVADCPPDGCPAGFGCATLTDLPIGVEKNGCCKLLELKCPSGSRPYKDAMDQPQRACKTDGNCRNGYQCVTSRSMDGRRVCCRGTDDAEFCPLGLAYRLPNSLVPMACQSDSVCPSGYRCEVGRGGGHCCSGPRSAARCPANRKAAMRTESRTVITCKTSKGCPSGFSCHSNSICCSEQITGVCPPGDEVAPNMQTRSAHLCDLGKNGVSCPTNFECKPIGLRRAPTLGACCRPKASAKAQCPEGSLYTVNGQPMECGVDQATRTCPTGFACLRSVTSSAWVCCSGESEGAASTCPLGTSLPGQGRRECLSASFRALAACAAGDVCLPEAHGPSFICCSPNRSSSSEEEGEETGRCPGGGRASETCSAGSPCRGALLICVQGLCCPSCRLAESTALRTGGSVPLCTPGGEHYAALQCPSEGVCACVDEWGVPLPTSPPALLLTAEYCAAQRTSRLSHALTRDPALH